MAAPVRLSLFGEPTLVADGCAVELPHSRKTRALLVLLALSGRPQRRDRLCEMFWDIPDDPRGSLRWSLSRLRRALEPFGAGWIEADRERVRLHAPELWMDCASMRAGLADGGGDDATLTEAALQPPLLGVDLPNQPLFQAWLTAERDELDSLRARWLKRAAARAAEPARALRLWQAAGEAVPGDAEACAGEAAALRALGRDAEADKLAAACGPLPPASPPAPPSPRALLARQDIRFTRTLDGASIAYACVGEGPPLVKAANWLSHLELDWDSPTWGRMFQEFAKDRRFIRYDERGCGLSDWDVADIGFEAFVRDLESVADALGLERFPLIGISQGGAVGIEYAARHPERVSHLVLLGAYAAGWRHEAPHEAEEREAVITLSRVGWGKADPVYRHIFSSTFMPAATPEEMAWFDEFQRRTASAENAARFLAAFSTIDVRDRLADVRAPTLVLHARGDHRVAWQRGQALAKGIPGARFVTLETEDHILLSREPAMDMLIAEVRAFLAN